MLKRIAVFLLAVLLVFPLSLSAQETNSSIGGAVKTAKGEPLVGATITATHVPTGTIYRTATRVGGRFALINLRPGGPYTVVVSFVGFNDETVGDVFLALGELSIHDFALAEKSSTLTEVVIAGRRAPPVAKAERKPVWAAIKWPTFLLLDGE